jgi:probable selenium-dependent hydroxylase accessory protein YqeC
MNLLEAFEIGEKEIISLVGGGGKTTLMYALANELVERGDSVITTTTTRIMPPDASQSRFLLVNNREQELLNQVTSNINSWRHITIADDRLSPSRLKGISLSLIKYLSHWPKIDQIIVEADGASRKPLKAPNATEPVIPDITTLLIPVIGLESIGQRLNDDTVFRSEIAAQLLGIPIDSLLTIDSIAELITDPRGIIKGCPLGSRIIPLLNKVDLLENISTAEALAIKILNRNHPKIHRVVLGQVLRWDKVIKLIKAV